MASAVGGYVSTFGKDEPMGSYDDIDQARIFFLVGSNTAEAHPVIFDQILLNRERHRVTIGTPEEIITSDNVDEQTFRTASVLELPTASEEDPEKGNGQEKKEKKDEDKDKEKKDKTELVESDAMTRRVWWIDGYIPIAKRLALATDLPIWIKAQDEKNFQFERDIHDSCFHENRQKGHF